MNGLLAAMVLKESDSLSLRATPTLKVGLGEPPSHVQELDRAWSCAGLRQSSTDLGS